MSLQRFLHGHLENSQNITLSCFWNESSNLVHTHTKDHWKEMLLQHFLYGHLENSQNITLSCL